MLKQATGHVLNVTQTGTIVASNELTGTLTTGILINNDAHAAKINIAGYVYADSEGILGASTLGRHSITITETSLVIGGSNKGESDPFQSAAIRVVGTDVSLANHGQIIGEFDFNFDRTTAVANTNNFVIGASLIAVLTRRIST